MSERLQDLSKAVLLAIISALVGGFSAHFYTQGQVDTRLSQLEKDVQRVDDNSATRRREGREEGIMWHNQQQRDIDDLREQVRIAR